MHDSDPTPIESSEASTLKSPEKLDLTAAQRAALSSSSRSARKAKGALLLTKVGAWYAARGGITDEPILGTTSEEVKTANQAARAMLKLDGTLHEPAATVAGRELAVGEIVTLRDSIDFLLDVYGGDLPPYTVFGTVEHIDAECRELVVDFATAGRLTIPFDSPDAAALEYGYAEKEGTSDDALHAGRTVSRTQDHGDLGAGLGADISP